MPGRVLALIPKANGPAGRRAARLSRRNAEKPYISGLGLKLLQGAGFGSGIQNQSSPGVSEFFTFLLIF